MRSRIDPDLVANGKFNILAGRAFYLFQMVSAFVCIQYPHMRYLHHKLRNIAEPEVIEQTDSYGLISRYQQSYNRLNCATVSSIRCNAPCKC